MQEPRKIIAIPTYNRPAEFLACLDCLSQAEGLADWHVLVADDCSTEYDIGDLIGQSGIACEIIRNTVNLGCDRNSVALLRACLERNVDRVFLLDSDMIVSGDVLVFGERVFDRTNGILSLYNSVLHSQVDAIDDDLVRKNSIGGAATLWDASVLQDILDRLPTDACWDWRACDVAYEQNIGLFVAKRSRAQHIGIEGTNSLKFGELEYGGGFAVETMAQAEAIARAHEKLMLSQSIYRERIRPSKVARWRNSIVKRLPKKAAGA